MNAYDLENASSLSIVKDPFNSDSMIGLSTYSFIGFSGQWEYSGTVKFKNGDTLGEQKFRGTSFKELLMKIEAFVLDLERVK